MKEPQELPCCWRVSRSKESWEEGKWWRRAALAADQLGGGAEGADGERWAETATRREAGEVMGEVWLYELLRVLIAGAGARQERVWG